MRTISLLVLGLTVGAGVVSAQEHASVAGLSHGLAVVAPGGELILAGPVLAGEPAVDGLAASTRCAQQWHWVAGSWAGIYTADGFQGYATVGDCVAFTDHGVTRLGYRLDGSQIQLNAGAVGYAMASTAPAQSVELLQDCTLSIPDGTASGTCSGNGGSALRWTTAEGQSSTLADVFLGSVFSVGMLDQRTALIVPGVGGSWSLWAIDHEGAELVSAIR